MVKLLYTGDVQKFCRAYPDLKKTIVEEVVSSLSTRFASGCDCSVERVTEVSGEIDEVSGDGGKELPPDIPPENISLHVKLFVSALTTKEDVERAVDSVLRQHPSLPVVEYLFISVADKTNTDLLLKCWPWIEELAESGKVKFLGLSDPRCQTIQPLIENCKIWPRGIQLFFTCEHTSNTCLDLLKLANYYKIRVTIHRDELADLAELNGALLAELGVQMSESWLLKYSIVDRKRKVLLKKGYIIEESTPSNGLKKSEE